jgi:hypothetical protein
MRGPIPDLHLEAKIIYPPHSSTMGSSVKIISAHAARVNPMVIAQL